MSENIPENNKDMLSEQTEPNSAEENISLQEFLSRPQEKTNEFDLLTVADEPKNPKSKNKKTTYSPKVKKDKKTKEKRGKSGCGLTVIWLGGIVIISVIIALSIIVVISDAVGIGKEMVVKYIHKKDHRETVLITVEEGQGVNEVAAVLEQHDLVLDDKLFMMYVKATGDGGDMSYGVHSFTLDMGYDAILNSLAEPALAEDLEVTVKSPMTVEEIAALMEEKEVCKAEDFLYEIENGTFNSPLWSAIPEDENLYIAAEGYLYPDTYRFYKHDDPNRVIQKMLDNLEEKYTDEMREETKKLGYSTHEILTLASIIETECCGYYDEMKKVSAIFYNRLNDWAPGTRKLQSDPSMHYAGGDLYDTYKIEGLPPGPISNFTEEALNAAVYPDPNVEDYYFFTDKYGEFYYNYTLEEHESDIDYVKSRGMWIEGYE